MGLRVRSAVAVLIVAVCAFTGCTSAEGGLGSALSQGKPTAGSVGDDSRRSITPADTDDFGFPLPNTPLEVSRVVSLNPTATEIIFAIGADSLLVGRSRWDEFPKGVERIQSVGDGIRPSVETVLSVQPTLVILYATADNRSAADALRRSGVTTVAFRVDRIDQFHALVMRLGMLLGTEGRARVVSDSVRATLARVSAAVAPLEKRPTVVWPLWESPPMVVGGGSYLDELLVIAGARNVFHDASEPSPTVNMEEIARRNPEFVMLTTERGKALRNSAAWKSVEAVRESRFLQVNSSLTGRPSVTLGMAAVHLARLLHPEIADSLR